MNLAIDYIEPVRRARATDPLTSHDAAARVGEFAPDHRARVLAALKRLGTAGAEQIGAECGMEPHAVRRRLPELEDARLAEPTEHTRKTSSGRSERLWRARG